MTMTTPGYTSSPDSQPPARKHHRIRNILLGVLAGIVLLIVFAVVVSALTGPGPAGNGSPSSSAQPVAAQPAATQPAAAQPAATQPAKPAAPVAVGRFSGTGNWNSPPFELNGNPVTVTYTYSGNIMAGESTGDNFMASMSSPSDDLSIANTIAVAGGTTTTLYPDTSSGDTSYHLEVQATGAWSFTITEAG